MIHKRRNCISYPYRLFFLKRIDPRYLAFHFIISNLSFQDIFLLHLFRYKNYRLIKKKKKIQCYDECFLNVSSVTFDALQFFSSFRFLRFEDGRSWPIRGALIRLPSLETPPLLVTARASLFLFFSASTNAPSNVCALTGYLHSDASTLCVRNISRGWFRGRRILHSPLCKRWISRIPCS